MLIAQNFAPLRGKRIGLITNQTGIARDGKSGIDLLFQASKQSNAGTFRIIALFSPEHGLRGERRRAQKSATAGIARRACLFTRSTAKRRSRRRKCFVIWMRWFLTFRTSVRAPIPTSARSACAWKRRRKTTSRLSCWIGPIPPAAIASKATFRPCVPLLCRQVPGSLSAWPDGRGTGAMFERREVSGGRRLVSAYSCADAGLEARHDMERNRLEVDCAQPACSLCANRFVLRGYGTGGGVVRPQHRHRDAPAVRVRGRSRLQRAAICGRIDKTQFKRRKIYACPLDAHAWRV